MTNTLHPEERVGGVSTTGLDYTFYPGERLGLKIKYRDFFCWGGAGSGFLLGKKNTRVEKGRS